MKVNNFVFAIFFCYFTMVFAQYQNVPIDTNSSDQSEVTIAISPINSNYIKASWNDFRTLPGHSEPGYAFSTDAGNIWNEGIVPDTGNYSYGIDPSSAFDNFENAFYCYIAQDFYGQGPIVVSRTTTFVPSSNWHYAKVSGSSSNQDKPFMTIDNTIDGSYSHNGRIYVSWADFSTGTRIKFSYSADHGVSFSSEVTLDSVSGNPGPGAYLTPGRIIGNPSSDYVQGAMPAVGPNGEVYVVWMYLNISSNPCYFKIRKSTDGGVTFAPEDTVASFSWFRWTWGYIEHSNLPSLTVDPSNGYIYVAYKSQFPDPDSIPRIKFVRSTDGGNNWSQPKVIGDDLGEKGEVFPWVACDVYGKVAVTFLHKDVDDSVDCYIMESYDHGANFQSPVKVSSKSSDPNLGTGPGYHYQGMVLDDAGNDYVVWTDHRNGNADPYFAKVNTPPEPPQNLISSVVGENDNPRIDWDANQETDLDYYEVWKKKGDGSWNLYATTSNNYYIDDEESNVRLSECVVCIPIYYKLKAVDLAGNLSDFSNAVGFSQPEGHEFKLSDLQGDSVVLATPDHFAIIQNYPNPFNPTTRIKYQLPQSSHVTLSIHNILGQQVRTLINSPMEAGYHSVEWDGRNDAGAQVGSGIYIYRFSAGNSGQGYLKVQKMILMK